MPRMAGAFEGFLVRTGAKLAAKYYIGNPKYAPLLESRFPSISCLCSEVVNRLCLTLRLDHVLMEPRYIFIETTNTCNIKCIMCPVPDNSRMTRKREMLKSEQLSALLEANPKVRVVYVTNWGEPLINRNIVDIIQQCSDRGLLTVMTSNSTRMTEELATEILNAGLGVVRFSLDGVGEYFERIRSVKYDQVKANIERFVHLRDLGGYKTRVELNVTYMKENLDGVRQVEAQWGEKVDFINYQGVISIPTLTVLQRKDHSVRRGACKQLYRSTFFLTNGDVVPCCADFNGELKLGNTQETKNSFEILNSPASRELRRSHLRGELPEICAACTQYNADDILPRKSSAIV